MMVSELGTDLVPAREQVLLAVELVGPGQSPGFANLQEISVSLFGSEIGYLNLVLMGLKYPPEPPLKV